MDDIIRKWQVGNVKIPIRYSSERMVVKAKVLRQIRGDDLSQISIVSTFINRRNKKWLKTKDTEEEN